jgi:predicted secreted hydrolase
MPVSVRWLVPAVVLLIAAAGFWLVPCWRDVDPITPRLAAGLDWAGVPDGLSDEEFAQSTGAWRLRLPADHGAHPDARTETWNLSVHLRDGRGEEIGIQFALLRVGLVPPDAPERGSPWELRGFYRGHVTLLDAAREAAGEERFHRDVPGVAGHDAARRELWLDNWVIRYGEGERGDRLKLDATVGEVELTLSLAPAKAAVALAPDGGRAPFRGYSVTRMVAEGYIGVGDDRQAVSGLAWLDHLWGDVPLPVGPIVLDRLQLQLDDGTDLSVTRTRRRDGGGTPTLAGYVVGRGGELELLPGVSLEMEATRIWHSDVAEGGFPLDWRLRAGDLRLNVVPLADDQVHGFAAPLWSGIVAGEGVRRDVPVSGRGTLMLTGDAAR